MVRSISISPPPKRTRVPDDSVPLRAYFERLLADQAVLFEVRLAAIEKAIELQAPKYEDHLSKLNHEHDTLKEMRDTYLRTDIYSQDKEAARLAAEKLSDAAASAQREQVATAAMVQRNRVTLAVTIALFVLSQIMVLVQHYPR